MKVNCTPNCSHTLYLSSYRAKLTTRAHSLSDCVTVSLTLTRCYTSALAPQSSDTSPSCETHTHTQKPVICSVARGYSCNISLGKPYGDGGDG